MGFFDKLFGKKSGKADASTAAGIQEAKSKISHPVSKSVIPPAPKKRPPALTGFKSYEVGMLCNSYARENVNKEKQARAQGGHFTDDKMLADLMPQISDPELDALIEYHQLMEKAESLSYGAPPDAKLTLYYKAHELIPGSLDCVEKIYEAFTWNQRFKEAVPWLICMADIDLDRAASRLKDLAPKLGDPLPSEIVQLKARIDRANQEAFFNRMLSQISATPIPLEEVLKARDRLMPGGGVWTGQTIAIANAIAAHLAPLPLDTTSGKAASPETGFSFAFVFNMTDGMSVCRLWVARLDKNRFAMFGDGIVRDWDESGGPLPETAHTPTLHKPEGAGPMDAGRIAKELEGLLAQAGLSRAAATVLEKGRDLMKKDDPRRTGVVLGAPPWVMNQLSNFLAAQKATSIRKERGLNALVAPFAILVSIRTETGTKLELTLLNIENDLLACYGDGITVECKEADGQTLEAMAAAKPHPTPAISAAHAVCRCDTCSKELKPREVFAISPRADMPANSRDVIRLLCETHFTSIFESGGKRIADSHILARANRWAQEHILDKGGIKGFPPLTAVDPLPDPGPSSQPSETGKPSGDGIQIKVGMTMEQVGRLIGRPKTQASAADIAGMSGMAGAPQRMGIAADTMYAIYEHATGTYKLVFRGGKVIEVNQHP